MNPRNRRYRMWLRYQPPNLAEFTGTNWSITNVGELKHTSGSTTSAVSVTRPDVQAEILTGIYRIEFGVTGRSAGTVTPGVYNVNGSAVSTNGNFAQDIDVTAVGSRVIRFVPSSTFNGTVTYVRVFRKEDT